MILKSLTRAKIIKISLKSLLFQVITLKFLDVLYLLCDEMQNILWYYLTLCNTVLGTNIVVIESVNQWSVFYVVAHWAELYSEFLDVMCYQAVLPSYFWYSHSIFQNHYIPWELQQSEKKSSFQLFNWEN